MRYDISQYSFANLEHKLSIARFHPLDILVTGVTGAGKSTTLNALFQRKVAQVGNGVEPQTMELTYYQLNDWIRLWGTPGLGDGVSQDARLQAKIVKLLNKKYVMEGRSYGFIDLAVVIVEAGRRDLGTTYRLLNDVVIPNIQPERVLVLVNQADLAMKGRHWMGNHPDDCLKAFLMEQARAFQARIRQDTGLNVPRPVFYSAEHGYGLGCVLNYIIRHVPLRRRPRPCRKIA